jgi:hypothetical protein
MKAHSQKFIELRLCAGETMDHTKAIANRALRSKAFFSKDSREILMRRSRMKVKRKLILLGQ